MSDTHEDFILELAGIHPDTHPGGDGIHGPRRVATPQGAAFYGQPIGTIITKDLLDKIHAEKGAAPKGATAPVKQAGGNKNLGTPGAADPNTPGGGGATSASGAGAGANAPKVHPAPVGGNKYKQQSYPAPGIDSTPPDHIANPKPVVAPQLAKGVIPSSINGPNKFSVGSAKYSAPEGSRLIRPKGDLPLAIVITPDKKMHFFVQAGEVEADTMVVKALEPRFGSKVKPDDANYAEQAFDTVQGLEQMAVGQHLHDKEGNKIFTKTDNGFVHSELGVPVSNEDIKPLHDSGELTTQGPKVAEENVTPDYGNDSENEIDFGSMDSQEFDSYVKTLDKGDKLHYTAGGDQGDDKNAKEYGTLTYEGDGNFSNDANDAKISGKSLFPVRKNLRTVEPTHLNKIGTQDAQQKQEASDKNSLGLSKAKAALETYKASPSYNPNSEKAHLLQQQVDIAQKTVDGTEPAPETPAQKAESAAKAAEQKAQKKAADTAAIEKDSQKALDEHTSLEDSKGKLSDTQKKDLLDTPLGSVPGATFKSKALKGSIITSSQNGKTEDWVATGEKGQWSPKANPKHKVPASLIGGKLTVKKNIFISETDEFNAPGENTPDEVGKQPSNDFLLNAPVGSEMQTGDGTDWFFSPNGGWVTQGAPNQGANNWAEVGDLAFAGDLKITHIPDGNQKLFVGQSIDSMADEQNLYEEALPGTILHYFANTGDSHYDFPVALNSDGVWHSGQDNSLSFELPNKPAGGSIYVAKLGSGTPNKKLGAGDEPTITWMEHAPVGQFITVKNDAGEDIPLMKHANGLWATQDAPEGQFEPHYALSFSKNGGSKILDGPPKARPEPTATMSGVPSHKAGDVASYQDYLDAPIGTQFHYHKKDGTLSDYSKLNADEVQMPDGIVQPNHHWEKSLNSGKVTFAHDVNGDAPHTPEVDLPEPTVAPTGVPSQDKKSFEQYVKDDAQAVQDLMILQLDEKFDAMHADEIEALSDGSVVDVQGEEYTKHGGMWYAPESDMGEGISSEDLLFGWNTASLVSGKMQNDTLDTSIADAITKAETPAPLNGISGISASQLQIHEAIAALEAHPHGSPVYGLQSIGGTDVYHNPIKVHKNEIIDAAKAHWPKDKPKAAVLKFLKSQVEVHNDDAQLENPDNPKIHLGSVKPAKNAFGVTGGDFSQSDIDQAIQILEGYDGKLYKSQLTQAGNPLAKLDFNTLVGPNKDKVAQKHAVIAHLKNEVKDLAPVQTQTLSDFTGEKTHGALAGEIEGTPGFIDGKSVGELVNGSSGVLIQKETGDHYLVTKKDLISWQAPDGVLSDIAVQNAANEGRFFLLDSSPNTYKGNLNKPIHDYDSLESLNIGSVVNESTEYTNNTLTKVADQFWEDQNGNQHSESKLHASLDEGTLTLVSQPNSIPENYIAPAALQAQPNPDSTSKYSPGIYTDTSGGSSNGNKIHVFADGSGAIINPSGGKYDYTEHDFQPGGLAWTELEKKTWDFKPVNYETAAPKAVKKTAVVKDTVKFNPKDVPDGSYYFGNPNTADTQVWHVKDGVVSLSDGSKISTVKLKNAFLKGALVNQYGNSAVLPKDHTGTVKFLNKDTTVDSLKQLYAALDVDGIELKPSHSSTVNYLALHGLYTDTSLTPYVLGHSGGSTSADFKETIKHTIEGIVGDPDTWKFNDTEAQVMNDFDWKVGAHQAFFPEYAAKDIASPNAYNWAGTEQIKNIAKNFGDGQTIGQHVTGMSKYDKHQWYKAFMDGHFKSMYNIEVKAATKQGVSHVGGWKHPGYEGNSITNKVTWAPSVMGEKSVQDDVPGNWSHLDDINNISPDEVNNYLIAANMQHPEQLNPQQKQFWVKAHREGNQWQVNYYSVLAKQKHEAGEASVSSTPEFKDNVAPAKPYNSQFVNTQYPVDGWNASNADAWAKDFLAGDVTVLDAKGNKVPTSLLTKHKDKFALANPNLNEVGVHSFAVADFFQELSEQKSIHDSKPVYKLAPTQTVKKSKHPIYNVVDQHGNKFLFKPAEDDIAGKVYRGKVEATANKIAKFFGTNAPFAEYVVFDGKPGTMQAETPHLKTLNGFNYATMDDKMGSDLAHEHLVDWMLDQDDNWAPNTLVTADGHLVGIDKGRAFRKYGAWNGMTSTNAMDVHTHLVYSDLYQAIKDGKIDKATADKIYLATRKRALKMSKADDGALLFLLHEATDDRTNWKVDYKIDGKPVPQTQQGMIDAFFDRKSKLPAQVDNLWKEIYAAAGHGDLPEPPKNQLGEGQHSGLDDENFHAAVLAVGAHGTSTLLASPHIENGHAISWEVNEQGTPAAFTQVTLTPSKQADALGWFQANSSKVGMTADKADPANFPDDEFGANYGATTVIAAKTVGFHAADGEYNQGALANYESAKEQVAKDAAFWNADLQPDANGNVSFPSGASVPFGQVDQYKMMLDHYQSKFGFIDNALATKTKPAQMVDKFKPIKLAPGQQIYLDGNGQKLVKLENGNWIYVNSNQTSMLTDGEAALTMKEGTWNKYEGNITEAPQQVFKASQNPNTFERSGTLKDFTLTTTGASAHGSYGQEYEVKLPTGESVYFRNSTATNTFEAQRGRLTIKVPNATTPGELNDGIQRANDWISTHLGVNLEAATHEDAELTYWKQMIPTLTRRKLAPGSKWALAEKDLKKKISEMGSSGTADFLDKMHEKYSVPEQNAFFRDLWGKHFGQDKIAKFVSDEKYLPHFESPNYTKLDHVQGSPIWDRVDYDLKDLKSANHMLAASVSHASGKNDVVSSGAMLSAEQRLRTLGNIISSSDQGTGGSNSVFFRVYNDTKTSGISFIVHPRAMLRTDTKSFHHHDAFGSTSHEKNWVHADPGKSWIENVVESVGHTGKETNLQNSASLFGDLELIVFESNEADKRNKAIQELKSKGLTEIRGVPIEDRLVFRADLAKAIEKLKKTWYNE